MRAIRFVLGLVLAASVPALGQTRYQLDQKQAQLNEQSRALDEVSKTFGQYVILRDQVLNGTDGFYVQSRQWFTDSAQWLSEWTPLVSALEGQTLANGDDAARVTASLNKQLSALKDLLSRQEQIIGRAQTTIRQFQSLQRADTQKLGAFAASGENFNAQVNQVQGELTKSVILFSTQLGGSLQDIATRLDRLLVLKLQKLALDFPQLVTSLKEVESTLLSIRLVDAEVSRLVALDLKVLEAFNKGRVYAAQSLFVQLEGSAKQLESKLAAESLLAAGAKQNGVTRIQSIVSKRKAELESGLALLTRKQRFTSYYRSEVISPVTGMVRRCRAPVIPKNIDCALLRSIVFPEPQIAAMTEDQQAYIEATLDRVKEGPISSIDRIQGEGR
jgi:hypothetical protein